MPVCREVLPDKEPLVMITSLTNIRRSINGCSNWKQEALTSLLTVEMKRWVGWSEETACYAANWDDEEKWLLTAVKFIKAKLNVLTTQVSSKWIELISPF